MNSSSPASISLCAITGQCHVPGSLICSNFTLQFSSIRGSLINRAKTDLHGKASTKPSFRRSCFLEKAKVGVNRKHIEKATNRDSLNNIVCFLLRALHKMKDYSFLTFGHPFCNFNTYALFFRRFCD
jgi:hypothetical protein